MKTYCYFHPKRLARWFCPTCEKPLCRECVKDSDVQIGGMFTSGCATCGGHVESLGSGNDIVPFWQRLPKFFLYPFKLQPLVLIFIVSLLGAHYKDSGIMQLIFIAFVIKYSFAVLKTTAEGDFVNPPPLLYSTFSHAVRSYFKLVFLFVLLSFAYVIVISLHDELIEAVFVLGLIYFLPAMLILLAKTNSLFTAVNPREFIHIGWHTKKSYLIMYFLIILLMGGPFTIERWFNGIFFDFAEVNYFFTTAMNSYFLIVIFYLMGYVIFQHHKELGFSVSFDVHDGYSNDSTAGRGIGKSRKNNSVEASVNQKIENLIKIGRYDEAIALMEQQNILFSKDIAFTSRYCKLIKLTGNYKSLAKYGSTVLSLLVVNGREQEAYEFYSELIKQDKDFRLVGGTLFRIAEWLKKTGKTKEALRAYKQFADANPQNPLIPQAYLSVAKIFVTMKNTQKAEKVLKCAIKKYPNSSYITSVKKYLGFLSNPDTVNT